MRWRAAGKAAILAGFLFADPTGLAAQLVDRPVVWDLRIGASASDQPEDFAEFACGTEAGPPARPLQGFTGYAECRPDARGLHAVYFRYDDEQEYVARAYEQVRLIDALAGTRVFGIDVVLNALFDADGVLRGLRIVSDPRGVDAADRNDHWALGGMLMNRFGADGWECESLPLGEGESPVTSFYIKDHCRKETAEYQFDVRREYLHRRGQYFTDEFGKAFPTYFVSSTAFEMLAVEQGDDR
jgi:hypothetical protein